MSEQNNGKVATLQRPATDDPEAWKSYWEAQGQPWRTEPEIDAEQQKYLAERRAIVPNIEQGIYPFKGIKLTRADVEWLLATHENGRGPVDWRDENQREREGLDLRGADLCHVDLRNMPLARLRGSIRWKEIHGLTEEQIEKTSMRLEQADLRQAHLEGAILTGVHLERADLRGAHLEASYLVRTHMERANMVSTFLDGAYLTEVCLADEKSIGPRLFETQWGNINLSSIDWTQIEMLDDEYKAQQYYASDSKTKQNKSKRLSRYEKAMKANRQLSAILQGQGLNEEAALFAYRAQKLQRIVFRRRKKFGQYLFSGFLDLLAGYGYRPGRSVLWYLVTIFAFALTYFALGHLPFFPDAFVFSLTSFHGRGFFPGLGSENSLHNPLVVLAAFEAVIGLVIEISFIATFTQRFFGR